MGQQERCSGLVCAGRDHQLRKARALVHLPAELQVSCLTQDDLCCGEDLQVPQHMAAHSGSCSVCQADVQVGLLVQSADQRDDLEGAFQVDHLNAQQNDYCLFPYLFLKGLQFIKMRGN